MPIKTIIFDMGNVLVPLNHERMKKKFSELGAKEVDAAFESKEVKQLWKDYDNNMDTDTFRKNIREKLKLSEAISDEKLDNAWNSLLEDVPTDRLELLDHLAKRKTCKIILLSNCNPLHYQHIQKQYGDKFKHLFDKQYYSHLMKMTKPNPDIYEFVLQDSQSHAAETVFFDDKLENIEGAKHVGINAKQISIEDTPLFITEEIEKLNKQEKYRSYKHTAMGVSCLLAATGLFLLKNWHGSHSQDVPSIAEFKL